MAEFIASEHRINSRNVLGVPQIIQPTQSDDAR